MEKFLKDYVKMYAEASEVDVNRAQVQQIVNNLMNEDDIWDTLDSYIADYFEEIEGGDV